MAVQKPVPHEDCTTTFDSYGLRLDVDAQEFNMSGGAVVFLDFDDVICLNSPFSGYDAQVELANEKQGMPSNRNVWNQLFDADAKANLRQLHSTWEPKYVISSSWTLLFGRTEIITILERCEMGFVALNLHDDWSTPKENLQGRRSAEIGFWLKRHPEALLSWTVLDDSHSGKDLLRSTLDLSFIVLCQESVGLQQAEAYKMHQALQKRHEQGTLRSR